MEKIKNIKLEEKELNEIKSLREENSRLTVDFGRIRLEMILLISISFVGSINIEC